MVPGGLLSPDHTDQSNSGPVLDWTNFIGGPHQTGPDQTRPDRGNTTEVEEMEEDKRTSSEQSFDSMDIGVLCVPSNWMQPSLP